MIIVEMMAALVNKLGLIIILAVLISRIGIFKRLVTKKNVNLVDQMILAAVFGFIGILGTYTSLPVDGALANTRIVGVMVGALLGGPVVGLLAGLIAGIHRYMIDIGGVTAFACAISTIVEGIFGGLCYYHVKDESKKWKYAFFIGALAEIIQMIIILILVKPFFLAFSIVKIVLIPMVVINAFGISIFIGIIENIYKEYERIAAVQAEKALKIANLTLPYFRRGLNREVAKNVAEIIYDFVDVGAIAITNHRETLAYTGIDQTEYNLQEIQLLAATNEVLTTGQYKIIQKQILGNFRKKPKLKSVIIVPLKERDKVVGTLRLYKKEANDITSLDEELALGLAQIFSTQIELSRVEHQEKLITEAELKALQAQINPHFLFNAINTIVSFMQFDVIQAKKLLISLADLFRKSLRNNQDVVDINTELEHIASYLEIEKARFGDKLKVEYDLQEEIPCQLPPLILQPIVENAIIHGILPKKYGGVVTIRSRQKEDHYVLEVIDNGVGMPQERLSSLLTDEADGKQVGLINVNKRLINLYGQDHQLEIHSEIDKGTKVLIKIPC